MPIEKEVLSPGLMIRKMFKEGDDKRDAGLTTPDNIIRYDNISYGPHPDNLLDVYHLKEDDGKKLPVIVSVHGGGWCYGDKERYQYYCMSLAQHHFAVVNYTYRLAPENKYPSSLEDTVNVFRWILDNAETCFFDTDHIFAVGDSAGGTLLGNYCNLATNPEYAKLMNMKAPVVPTAVGLNCGAYDLSDTKQGEGLMAEVLPNKGTKEEVNQIDVLPHITENFPPAFVMTATEDFLKKDAPKIAAKFAEKGVPFFSKMYGSKDNPLGHVFHCNMKSEDAKTCNTEETEFFKAFIK